MQRALGLSPGLVTYQLCDLEIYGNFSEPQRTT
jgi:hypothetical protein